MTQQCSAVAVQTETYEHTPPPVILTAMSRGSLSIFDGNLFRAFQKMYKIVDINKCHVGLLAHLYGLKPRRQTKSSS